MSYSIIRVQKMNGQAIKGMQIHNQREKDSQTNPDIRKEDLHLNYDLIHGQEKIDYKQEIQQVISENVKSDKKIRKDAVLVSEFLITSDTTFFDNLSPDEQKRYFETAKDFIADRYGQQNVIYATVHNDEKTPHMHVGIVPVTEDGRLSAKEVIGNRMALVKLQDAFNAHVKAHGFDLERGLSRKGRKHVDMPKYKQLTAFEAEKEALATYEQTVSKIKAIDEKTKALEDLPDPTRMIGRAMLKSEDYDTLVNYATNGAVAEVEVMDLQRKLAEKDQEIRQLKNEMQDGQDKLRKNYAGIEYRNEEILSNLEKLTDEKANKKAEKILKSIDVVEKYEEGVIEYNKLRAEYKIVYADRERLKSENKSLARSNAGLEAENKTLVEDKSVLQNRIIELTNEFAAWKDRARMALHNQFKRIVIRLKGVGIEPDKLKGLAQVEEKFVAASFNEIENPKKSEKFQEMER